MRDRKLLNMELGRISPEQYRDLQQSGVVVVLDNVRSAHNVGSAFRTAVAFPPSAEIHKSALGAEASVEWEHVGDTLTLIRRLKAEGYTPVAVEQTEHSVSLDSFRREKGKRYALVFGNEVNGVAQDVVDECDFSLEIPQWGTKHSLNVSVSVGVVLWAFRPE